MKTQCNNGKNIFYSYRSYHETEHNNNEVEVSYQNGGEIRSPRMYEKRLGGMSWKTECHVVHGANNSFYSL